MNVILLPQLEWVLTENDRASIIASLMGLDFSNDGKAMVSTLDSEITVSMFVPSL